MNISPVIPDVYQDDFDGRPNIGALVAAGEPWAGLGMKATEGLYYPKDPSWFQSVWPAARSAAGARYGVDWFRWCYHYFIVGEDGAKQADFMQGLVESVGGWGPGDLPAVIDVEAVEQPANATAQQVIDGVSSFAARYAQLSGKDPILYGGEYIRQLGITSHMGCQLLITACYGSTLPARLYLDMGWRLDELLAWQYCSTDGYTGPAGYPQQCPLGNGPADLSAITIDNGASYDEQILVLRQLCA